MKEKSLQKAEEFLRIVLHILISVYMISIITVMPFYFTDGYGRIGTNKYEFFYKETMLMGKAILPVLGVFWLVLLLKEWKRNKKLLSKLYLRMKKLSLSATDLFAIFYGIALTFSYLHSDYKEMTAYGNAWKGANGWYMGLSTQLLFLGIYFAVSRLWKPGKWLLSLWIPVTLVVYLLGCCNRFGVYPIEMEHASPWFISTIGNINWYCGYIVTVFFGLLYYWWTGTIRNRWADILLAVYCVVGFGALLTQGSGSGMLTLGVMCLVFFLLSLESGQKMQRLWMMAVLLGIACTITYILRKCFAERFNYTDTLMDLLTDTPMAVLILLFGLGMYLLTAYWNKQGRYPQRCFVILGKVMIWLAVGVTLLAVAAIALNTRKPGSLGSLSENPFFTFDMDWGSSRGATWIAGIWCWRDQDLLGKLLGIGPDCMSSYIHLGTNPELLAMVQKEFPGLRLTNAHCEWLTILINEGVLGLLAFGGMIVTAIRRYLKNGSSHVVAAACGMCVLAYTINNVVSFQQAMSTATMFLVLGIGEASVKNP